MKKIIITGATSGIGKSLLDTMIKNDWFVIGTFHSDKKTAQTIEKKYPNSVKFFELDLCSSKSILSFSKKIQENYQQIDVLINNAGYVFIDTLTKTSFVEIEKQLNTNLTGTIKLTKELAPLISEKIINIASQYSKEAHKDYAIYCASKWGLSGFSKALAEELPNLVVLIANPGPVKTRMNNFWEHAIDSKKFAETFYKEIFKTKKYKTGDDIDLYKILKSSK